MSPDTILTFIESHEEFYVTHLLTDGDASNRENGLERLCKHIRAKRTPRQKAKLLTILMGLLQDETPSVRRWALNALALIGNSNQLAAIRNAIKDNRDDLDVFGAGVSALAAISNNENVHQVFKEIDLPLEGPVLFAAAQQSGHFKKELRATKVDLNRINDADLRLVMLLIGLGRAPEHLFSSKHRNKDVIGTLNKHPDRLVAQYSVWATYENPKFGLKDLRISLKDIHGERPNVRKYVYRLITSNESDAKKYYEQLVEGSQDSQVEVRAGLAEGMRNLHFDAIDDLALRWFVDEQSEGVKHALLEHMAVNIEELPNYREPVLVSYEQALSGSLIRSRLEAAARGTPLFRDLKLIAISQEQRDLFDDEISPVESYKSSTAMANGQYSVEYDAEVFANTATVLIVTALAKELAAASAVLNAQAQNFAKDGDSNLYQLGLVQGVGRGEPVRPILITSSGMGTESAATLAANAIRSYPAVRHIIMVGIAGGCPNRNNSEHHVRLGDVVTSSEKGIIAYDAVKETGKAREIRGTAQAPSYQLLGVKRSLDSGALQGRKPWVKFISDGLEKLSDVYRRPPSEKDILYEEGAPVAHPIQRNRVLDEPLIHAGVIGASNTLQKNSSTRDMLRDKFGVKAVEMEASGLQVAAWAQGKDVFVIRSICDYCDEHKNDDWQNYCALAAAAYARAMIEHMPRSWFPAAD